MLFLVLPHAVKVSVTIAVAVLCAALILYLALGLVFFLIALGSKRRPDETVPAKNSLFERNKDNVTLKNGYRWFDETYKQSVTIASRKGKTLHAVEFRNPSNSSNWAICVHGWTNVKREMCTYAMEYYRRGFNVLIPEVHGHGDSESRFVSMGWLDRLDLVDWVRSLVKENPRVRIVLHGVSMGAGAVMMTTGEDLPKNVVCAIEDCGFTGVKDIFTDQCIRKYHLPPKLVLPAASFVNLLLNGFTFGKASCIEQLKKSKTPTLFLHGDKDDFVLFENLDKVYDACAAEKEKHVIHGAEHAVSVMWYPEEYWQVCDAFLAKYFIR
ncbi:MAG: alpha/beta hydrolase [Clostridia bacterium]|nr:alpha/beta hydrolase [Clostridia bacterium]MBR3554013.1 alpha/beta hydrolase [Clostridia bacterium]